MTLSRTLRRRLVILGALVLLFTITGFFILPPIVKTQLERRLSTELGRRVTVGKVRLNPYALSLTLENFAIQEPDGRATFLGWRRLYVNFDALSSLRGEWVLSDVALEGFSVRGRVRADGSLNISDLLKKYAPPPAAAAPAPAAPARPLRIVHLQIGDARIDLADASRPQPFATIVGPLSFDLTEFRTAGGRGAPYHFSAVTEAGEKLTWSGTLRAAPFQSVGDLAIEHLVLAKYAPYYADRIQADIVNGRLSLHGHYTLDLTAQHEVMRLEGGAVQLRDLVVRARGAEQPTVTLPALDVDGISADARAARATIAQVTLTGGQVRVRREKDGGLNLLTMLQPPPAGAAGAAAIAAAPAVTGAAAGGPTAAPLPDVRVGAVAVKDLQVEVEDLAAPRPAHLALSGVQLALKDVTLQAGAKMPLDATFQWAPHGNVHVAGPVSLTPLAAALALEVKGFELLPLSPYLEQFANVRLSQGAIDAKLQADVALPTGKAPEANVSGELALAKLGVVDAADNEELAGLGRLALHGLRARTAPQLSVALDEIAIDGPYARVRVNADQSLNVANLMAKPAGPAGGTTPAVMQTGATAAPASAVPAVATLTPAAAVPAAPPPEITIGRITIRDGDFRFADRSLTPGVGMTIAQFGGTITGLSSANFAKADVDLKALVDGAGPVAITGKLDPLSPKPTVDLAVDFKNVDLVPLSPYSGKFAGYELARGKLALDVKLALDGRKVDATNVITLHQFTFGAPVASPEATKLPVRLGVALLKDLDGKIVIDVPVQGSLDDPNFRIGRVVLRVVVNLLTKAAVSPFSLLGSMFGGGGEELAYQEFAPGAAELQPAEVKKLETMVQALTNRPGLSLALEGSYDTAADTYALKRLKLADRVRRTVWEQKRQSDPNIAPPDQLVITPEDNQGTIKSLFDAAFPPGTQFGAPLAAAPAVTAAPAPTTRPWLLRRALRLLTFHSGSTAAKPAAAPKAAPKGTDTAATMAAAGPSLEEMTGRLADTMTVDENDLRALAQARAQRVRDYFVVTGKIAGERLFLSGSQPGAAAPSGSKGPRVFLQLQ